MSHAPPTSVYCIVPRLGTDVGGGKIHAIYRRMNLFAARDNTSVTLVGLHHSVNQRINFAHLQSDGVLDTRIRFQSLVDLSAPDDHRSNVSNHTRFPDWDLKETKPGHKTRHSYFAGHALVMQDTSEATAAGLLTIRRVLTDPSRDTRLKYFDGILVESLSRFGDGVVERMFYADGRLIASTRHENKAFLSAENTVTRQRCSDEFQLQKTLAQNAFPADGVVFIDGITSAYLAPFIGSRKVLFLHADHRSPKGRIMPRSRLMIDQFDGDAIVTATHKHKARLEADLRPGAPIRVIPHYVDRQPPLDQNRRDICTVSRLYLDGKPIHHCIEAFTRVMHLLPDCNYVIYGDGTGRARLEQLIKHHRCEERVFVRGHTPDAEQVFATSLMSLAPTRTEGFGLALLESLTHGCPVISYDVDYGPRELIHPGVNGELVAPGDIDGIARAILKVHAQRDAYSNASLETADRYSFDAYRDRYFHLMDEIVGLGRHFDIQAPDLLQETRAAIDAAPFRHKARLLDLCIALSSDRRDLEGAYWAFQQKVDLFPQAQRPLKRCIWLSLRLGRMDAFRAHLALFAHRFPDHYSDFVAQHPDILASAEAEDAAT
ncbi:glycosyltransferase [Marivita hallyeonensis]|uniref:Glycosyltransferase involved in cell wall bisynthesis n=1 Tax=Marivita hallyeonensis TaxID=996342 RepID=A0A1M5R818_9RHOB|nr:glycosyltransferase [Marivita hallyeonensis]SHH22495.1 Glycosyltransferase involved in cell wall bisynthesis [Marivita hallyeonensis]